MKDKYIDTIRGLYPADSRYPDTAEIGRRLLLEAMEKTAFNWRDLPEDVLRIYAELCEQEDAKSIRSALRRAFNK